MLTHPHLRYINTRKRGYLLVDIDHTRIIGEWYHTESVLELDSALSLAKAYRVDAGKARLLEEAEQTSIIAGRPPLV